MLIHISLTKRHMTHLLGSTSQQLEEDLSCGSRIVKKDDSQLVLVDQGKKLISRREFFYSHLHFPFSNQRI
jgi:hypothetical protein